MVIPTSFAAETRISLVNAANRTILDSRDAAVSLIMHAAFAGNSFANGEKHVETSQNPRSIGIPAARHRAVRPGPEVLEERHLLSVLLGDQWTYDSRITYSFMPDGTNVGGVPSVLFQTLNAKYRDGDLGDSRSSRPRRSGRTATNVNLALVSDGGEAVGTSGDQQDDPRFGDIRIGAVPLAAGVLAETFLPPPANGGTDAGDILFNSTINWQINSNYDLMTVAAHEFGHALGLGSRPDSTAVMYGTYNGIKQALTSDDIAGIDSIYGTRQFDQFNSGGNRNNTYFTADEHQLVHQRQRADRHPQPGHHDAWRFRMVLRQRPLRRPRGR